MTGPDRNSARGPIAISISPYLRVIRRYRWPILSFIVGCVAATWVISKVITPRYESTATLEIEPSGTDAESRDSFFAFFATQIGLLQSDSVLRPVVEQYNLWEGGRKTKSSGQDADIPRPLRGLSITQSARTYLVVISYRSPDPRVAANVVNAIVESYRLYSLSDTLKKHLDRLKAALAARLRQLNGDLARTEAERRAKEAAWRSVQNGTDEAASLFSQANLLKKTADLLNEATQKSSHQTDDERRLEYRKDVTQWAEAERRFQDARENVAKRAQEEYRDALSRESGLQRVIADSRVEFDHLNTRLVEYVTLIPAARGDTKRYEQLMREMKDWGIDLGLQDNKITILHGARPARNPAFPNLKLNLFLAFFFSTVLALGGAFLSDALNNRIRDPYQLKALFDLEVLGIIPQIKAWCGKSVPALTAHESSTTPIAGTPGEEILTSFEEAIQALRGSILLATFDRPLKSILITSAGPAEGRTTTAVHLAIANAKLNQKTLLVDGDLSMPGVSRKFNLTASTGLATALHNGLQWRKELITIENLDVLPAGPGDRSTARLIGASFAQILSEAESTYDMIIVDAPPILLSPGTMQMATLVDGVVVVAKAGATTRTALISAIQILQRVRSNIIGLVLNELTEEMRDQYYGSYGEDYN